MRYTLLIILTCLLFACAGEEKKAVSYVPREGIKADTIEPEAKGTVIYDHQEPESKAGVIYETSEVKTKTGVIYI